MKFLSLLFFFWGINISMLASNVLDSFIWHDNVLMYGKDRVGYISEEISKGLKIERNIQTVKEGLFKINNVLIAQMNLDSVSAIFNFVHQGSPSYLMIPSVNYNGNKWGIGNLEPKGFVQNGVARSFEYRRVPIPGATFSETPQFSVAMWGTEQKTVNDVHFSCSLYPRKDEVTHSLIYPDEELPDSYSGRDQYSVGYKNYLSLKKNQTLQVTYYIYVDKTLPAHKAIHGFFDAAWEMADKPCYKTLNCLQIWNRGINYAKNYLWAEEEGYKGFSIGLTPNNTGGFSQREMWKYEIGWCGNNASLANSFLYNFMLTNDSLFYHKAMDCLDTWTSNTSLDNGLFITHYDNILAGNEGVLDACNLGAAAYNFFISDSLCNRIGVHRKDLRNIALGICDFMLKDQMDSGQYGKGWDYSGKCIYREGTIGAFLIPAMVEAYKKNGKCKYLYSAERAFKFYMNQFRELGYTTAGALDTWCIDCESAWPMLRSALALFYVKKDFSYLIDAEAVSYYIASWQWLYTIPMPLDDDFTKYGYNTFGASGVSTQHHHISSHTVCIVADWIELSDLLNKPIWRERARALWKNSSQLISDGSLVIHDRIRPEGSQNEAFFQSRWNFYSGEVTYSINDWLVAWPTAFRLEVLRRVQDWEILN